MNTNDLLTRWSSLSFEEIEEQLASGADAGEVEQLLGPEGTAETYAWLAAPSARGLREAVVFLPGIMGSLLSSVRGITTLLWINPAVFLKGQCNYLDLNTDGTDDANPLVEVEATSLEKLTYLKAILALRSQTDLYEFPYDWRRPIEWNGDLLHRCLERWAAGNPDQQFTLVGHSMGGLVSRAYMARHTQAAEKRIKRLIMHGTPHFGAAGAVENMILGNRMMAIAEALNSNNVTRQLLLNMPSTYQLLPAPPDLFPSSRPYPAAWDLYRAAAWQLDGIRQDFLDAGRRFHQLLASVTPQIDITEIAGCNVSTVVEVQRSFGAGDKPQFDLVRVEEGSDAGDGTVPLWSALLPGATIYYVQQVHRYLSSHKDVIDATLELIHDGTPTLPTSLPPRRSGLFGRDTLTPVEVEAENLRERLESGTASDDDLSLLYFAT